MDYKTTMDDQRPSNTWCGYYYTRRHIMYKSKAQ